ncbi:hypothetical protein M513_07257 [Trichuris suis]|uniref:Reverse transcriptase RNase H-like domain-containing protein n=1 Tax=Trichuris suis TaxID=68888 RepID=A0A085M3Y2_9BILA|nr:hypothetical protein M513_07257 [Trichuris suis]
MPGWAQVVKPSDEPDGALAGGVYIHASPWRDMGILKDSYIDAYCDHLQILHDDFQRRFHALLPLAVPSWVFDPFTNAADAELHLQKELIDLQSNDELKPRMGQGYGHVVADLVTKERNRLQIVNRGDLRLRVTTMEPDTEDLVRSHVDREGLVTVFAIQKFRRLVLGRKFTIFTDHKSLLGLLQQCKPIKDCMPPRMTRSSLILSSYDHELRYRPGKLIGAADA